MVLYIKIVLLVKSVYNFYLLTLVFRPKLDGQKSEPVNSYVNEKLVIEMKHIFHVVLQPCALFYRTSVQFCFHK